MKLGCVIMAAGSGSRFGANKLLQPFLHKPLYQWAVDAVPCGVFQTVCVVTGYEAVAAAAEEKGFCVVWNDQPERGISRTIRLGLEQTGQLDGVLFMTADQPLLTPWTIERLAAAFVLEPTAIVAAAHDGKRGNPCLFPPDLFPQLRQLEGDTGGAKVIRQVPDRLRLVEVPEEELTDCDTAMMLRNLEKKQKTG